MHSNSDKSILFSTLSEFPLPESLQPYQKKLHLIRSEFRSAIRSIYPCQSFLLLFPEFLLYQSTDNSEENTAAGNFFLSSRGFLFSFVARFLSPPSGSPYGNHPDLPVSGYILSHHIGLLPVQSRMWTCKCKITVSTEDYDLQRRIFFLGTS